MAFPTTFDPHCLHTNPQISAKMDYNEVWETVTNYLCNKTQDVYREEDLLPYIDTLHQYGLATIIEEWFYESIQEHMREQIKPAFWSNFVTEIPSGSVLEHLQRSLDGLHREYMNIWPCVERLNLIYKCIARVTGLPITDIQKYPDPREEILLYTKAIVFHTGNQVFNKAITEFYTQCFKAFDASTKASLDNGDCDSDGGEEEEEETLLCEGCDKEKETCTCSQILSVFRNVNTHLKDLGVLDRISGEAVSALIHLRISKHVEHTCKGNFETQFIQSLEEWLDVKVVGWLSQIYNQPTDSAPDSALSAGDSSPDSAPVPLNPIAAHKGRLYHYMYETYAQVRIQQLFNIIIEYPESEPALVDLKCCLDKSNMRGHLVKSLKAALETRLLHPGVDTADILTAYISAIRALRSLDPSGVLLHLVCQPVRQYLRQREDTVRCIVTSLTEEGSSELSDELVKGEPLVLDDDSSGDGGDGDTPTVPADDEAANAKSENWQAWMPDPVDADPGKQSGSRRRCSDIISMLVNIYGSKELFVSEYRTLLANRLLTACSGYASVEREIRYLELLKMRFGEAQLHFCEVMLKDVSDSKRINTNITDDRKRQKKAAKEAARAAKETVAKDEEEEMPLNSMILSAQFWPSFREEKLTLPPGMQQCLEDYTKAFEALKGNRTLNWKTHLGLVDLELEMTDRVLKLKVSPTHAAIIWHFQEKERWTIAELSTELCVPAAAVRRKVALWQSHGVLREDGPDALVLVDRGTAGSGGGNQQTVVLEHHHDDDDMAESAMASAADQKEEELQMIWQYVTGMLTNLESLTLERIHVMLKMFARTGPGAADCTSHELKAFLDRKVKDQKLTFVSGVYRLCKSS